MGHGASEEFAYLTLVYFMNLEYAVCQKGTVIGVITTGGITQPAKVVFDKTINCQLSTINCQLSTVNYQLSTVNYQLSTAI
jgi:hypothetical protein